MKLPSISAKSAQGQTRTSSLGAGCPLPPSADIGPGGQSNIDRTSGRVKLIKLGVGKLERHAPSLHGLALSNCGIFRS